MSRLEQLQKLATLHPNDPLIHYGIGLELSNQQRWAEAIAAFDATISADRTYSAAYYQKAKSQIGAAAAEDARHTLRDGMNIARESGDLHTVGEMQTLLESIQ